VPLLSNGVIKEGEKFKESGDGAADVGNEEQGKLEKKSTGKLSEDTQTVAENPFQSPVSAEVKKVKQQILDIRAEYEEERGGKGHKQEEAIEEVDIDVRVEKMNKEAQAKDVDTPERESGKGMYLLCNDPSETQGSEEAEIDVNPVNAAVLTKQVNFQGNLCPTLCSDHIPTETHDPAGGGVNQASQLTTEFQNEMKNLDSMTQEPIDDSIMWQEMACIEAKNMKDALCDASGVIIDTAGGATQRVEQSELGFVTVNDPPSEGGTQDTRMGTIYRREQGQKVQFDTSTSGGGENMNKGGRTVDEGVRELVIGMKHNGKGGLQMQEEIDSQLEKLVIDVLPQPVMQQVEEEPVYKQKVGEEPAYKQKVEEEPAYKQKAEEEPAHKQKAEEESTHKQKTEEESTHKQKAEEEPTQKQKAEEEPADEQKAEEEPAYKQKAEEEPADEQKAEEEPTNKQKAEEEPAHKQKAEEEPAHKQKAEEEPAYKQKAEEEPAHKQKAEEEPTHKQKAEEKPAHKQKAEEEPAHKQKAEEEIADKQKAEEEPAHKQKAEEEPADEQKVVGFEELEEAFELKESVEEGLDQTIGQVPAHKNESTTDVGGDLQKHPLKLLKELVTDWGDNLRQQLRPGSVEDTEMGGKEDEVIDGEVEMAEDPVTVLDDETEEIPRKKLEEEIPVTISSPSSDATDETEVEKNQKLYGDKVHVGKEEEDKDGNQSKKQNVVKEEQQQIEKVDVQKVKEEGKEKTKENRKTELDINVKGLKQTMENGILCLQPQPPGKEGWSKAKVLSPRRKDNDWIKNVQPEEVLAPEVKDWRKELRPAPKDIWETEKGGKEWPKKEATPKKKCSPGKDDWIKELKSVIKDESLPKKKDEQVKKKRVVLLEDGHSYIPQRELMIPEKKEEVKLISHRKVESPVSTERRNSRTLPDYHVSLYVKVRICSRHTLLHRLHRSMCVFLRKHCRLYSNRAIFTSLSLSVIAALTL